MSALDRQVENLFHRRMSRREILKASAALGAGGIGVLGVAEFLAACSTGSSPSGSATGRGGTLVFGSELATLPSLNANAANDSGFAGLGVVQHMFEGLVGWDFYSSLGQSENPPAAPALATSWTSSADRLTWTFQLRHGVKFQDGTDFNADAVLFNFDRAWTKSSPYFDALVSTYVQIWTQAVSDITKVDDYTVRVQLNAPRPLDLQAQYFLISSPTAVKKYGSEFGQHPVGTGPFQLKNVVAGQSIEFQANKGYWNTGYPKLDSLIYRPIPDASARTASLLSGGTNFIDAIQPDDIAAIKAAGFQFSQDAYPQYWTWWFNTHSGPFANKLVRQAANYAVDKESLVTNLLKGTAVASYQPMPPYSPLFNPNIGQNGKVYIFNPQKAKQLLAAAGYPNGVDVLVHVPTSGSGMMEPVAMSTVVQSNLRDVGIRVTLKTWEWASFVPNVLVTANKPPWDAFVLGHTILDQAWYWTNFNTAAWAPTSWNMNHYSNSQVDALSNQMLTTSDPAQITALAYQLDQLLVEDAGNLYVCHDTNPKAYAPNVKGFVDSHSWAFTIPFERVYTT